MSNEPNTHLSQEAPQWMKDIFQELSEMFEELFPDADRLNLEEMQRRLDEQQAHLATRTQRPMPATAHIHHAPSGIRSRRFGLL